ncbi:MAG: hypothetical protein ABF267_03110 [Glaciecola sp.]|jgi:chemotaxis protein CheY-P-specific phosphatase CheC
MLSDSSFGDVAKILNITQEIDDQLQLEVLMDAASILIWTCLTGIGQQLDLSLRQGQPIVLGQHRNVSELLTANLTKWRRSRAIELSYGIEGYDVQCDLILLFTEDSMAIMNKKLAHLLEDEDREYNIHMWNDFMESHSGLNAADAKGQSLFSVNPSINAAWFAQKTKAVFDLNVRSFMTWEQRPYLFKFANYRPITGTEDFMYQNVSISPLTSATGAVDYISMMIYDTTDKAAAKKQLEALQVYVDEANELR